MPIPDSPVPFSVSETPLDEVGGEQGVVGFQEDDWENDPQNARNWTSAQKWAAVSIVRPRFLSFRAHF